MAVKPPRARPHQVETPRWCASRPAVYAPQPKKAASPNDTWPVYPAMRFHADPMTTHIRKRIIRCR
jgi:hypothetical protein